MQFLLTEEEFASMVPRADLEARDVALEVARIAILGTNPCIHDSVKGDPRDRRRGGYCDDCPIAALGERSIRLICKRPKEWSK